MQKYNCSQLAPIQLPLFSWKLTIYSNNNYIIYYLFSFGNISSSLLLLASFKIHAIHIIIYSIRSYNKFICLSFYRICTWRILPRAKYNPLKLVTEYIELILAIGLCTNSFAYGFYHQYKQLIQAIYTFSYSLVNASRSNGRFLLD